MKLKLPLAAFAALLSAIGLSIGLSVATAASVESKDVAQKADSQVNNALIVDTGQQQNAQASPQRDALVKEVDNTLLGKDVYNMTTQSEQQATTGALQKASFQPGAGLQMINADMHDVAADSRTAMPQTVITMHASRTVAGISKFDSLVALQTDAIIMDQDGGAVAATSSLFGNVTS